MTDAAIANYDLKEEIRAYWSGRAATFDASVGHRIADGAEAEAWRRLLRAGLGPIEGRPVLDLACGTGEISRMLLDLGATVTGADFAEPMLERAAAKAARRPWQGRLVDAETLAGLPDAAFDGAVTRHLVWTLTDPHAAFAAWFRVLRPGGRLLVIDGDWVSDGPRSHALRRLAALIGGGRPRHRSPEDEDVHARILSGVHYREGLTADRLAADLARAGFVEPRRHGVAPIYLVGMRGVPLADRLRLLAPVRFALSVRRPEGGGR